MTSVLGSLASGTDEAASKNFPGTASLMSVNVTVCACALAAASSRAAITVTVFVFVLVMCALPCPISGSWRLRHLLTGCYRGGLAERSCPVRQRHLAAYARAARQP